MSKLIMIREAGLLTDGSYRTEIWNGPLNSKARHYIRKLMSEHFEYLYRTWPFVDHIDLVVTIYDEKGDVSPVWLTYGGIIAGDQWHMYAGCYWGTPRMSRWTRELSREEMKMYLNSKYGRVAEQFRFGDVNYNVRNDVYFDYD